MLRMEASLASFVRLLWRSRTWAKAEPRPVLQIRNHYAGKVRSPVLLLFLWFVFQIRRVLMVRMSEIRIVPMVREGNMYCLFIFFCMID